MYRPSGARAPPSAVPSQAAAAVRPVPAIRRIGAPAMPSTTGATRISQLTTSGEPLPETFIASCLPSPFGERRVPDATADTRVGATRSMVTPTCAGRPAATGSAAGHG